MVPVDNRRDSENTLVMSPSPYLGLKQSLSPQNNGAGIFAVAVHQVSIFTLN
jgi:hypothetical protein